MTDRPVSLVGPDHPDVVAEQALEEADLPHERLDLYEVLELSYRTILSWQGVSWAKGTAGDQLKRAASSAVLRYTEGYYPDGGNKSSLWKGARASCGEAAAAIQLLAIEGKVPQVEAERVRALLARAMRMLARLLQPR